MNAAHCSAPDFEISHPKFHKKHDMLPVGDINAMMALIKQYPDAKKKSDAYAEKAGFTDIESFYRYSMRLMSAVSAIMQEKHNPNYNAKRNQEVREQALKNRMRYLGEHNEEGLAELKEEFKQMQIEEEHNQKIIAAASTADKQFIRDNFDWVMSMMSPPSE